MVLKSNAKANTKYKQQQQGKKKKTKNFSAEICWIQSHICTTFRYIKKNSQIVTYVFILLEFIVAIGVRGCK